MRYIPVWKKNETVFFPCNTENAYSELNNHVYKMSLFIVGPWFNSVNYGFSYWCIRTRISFDGVYDLRLLWLIQKGCLSEYMILFLMFILIMSIRGMRWRWISPFHFSNQMRIWGDDFMNLIMQMRMIDVSVRNTTTFRKDSNESQWLAQQARQKLLEI